MIFQTNIIASYNQTTTEYNKFYLWNLVKKMLKLP